MKSIKALADLSGRLALITGGAGHIGTSIAEALAEQGCDIVLLDINESRLDNCVSKIKNDYGVNVYPLIFDLENSLEIYTVSDTLCKQFGKLDILVNNAAFVGTTNLKGWCVPFMDQEVETWQRAMEVNLTSAFALTKFCAKLMEKSNSASIINISSIYGILGPDMSLYKDTPMGNPAAYAASKGGIIQLTKYLATVLAPNIRVNAVSPGGIERGQLESFKSRYINRVPLGRMGSEEDLKGVATFLASDLSAYITGQNIVVDGGYSVW